MDGLNEQRSIPNRERGSWKVKGKSRQEVINTHNRLQGPVLYREQRGEAAVEAQGEGGGGGPVIVSINSTCFTDDG